MRNYERFWQVQNHVKRLPCGLRKIILLFEKAGQ